MLQFTYNKVKRIPSKLLKTLVEKTKYDSDWTDWNFAWGCIKYQKNYPILTTSQYHKILYILQKRGLIKIIQE